jgi:succinoglycan biosynthesis transport protein ExoP
MAGQGADTNPAPSSPLGAHEAQMGSGGKPAVPSAITVPLSPNADGGGAMFSPLASEERGNEGIPGLLRTVKRRQGLFLLTSGVVAGTLAINILRQRVFSPVYEGGFQMQISNPLEDKQSVGNAGSIESIARSNLKTDVPSLIVLLRSPLLLKPLAAQQGVPVSELIKSLRIQAASTEVQNVLNVSLRWGDPVKGRAILSALSKDYTKFSLTRRQAALDSAIQFLNRQGPEIQSRVDELQKEMLRFRERNNFLDPQTTASSILAAREDLVANLSYLQNEQVQLTSQIKSIEAGTLQFTPSGAPQAIEQLGREGVLVPGRSDGSAPVVGAPTPSQQLYDIEEELALARGTFREDTPVVQSLLARRDQLRPVVRQKALDAVRAQLLANVAQQDEINRRILLLNENFRSSPQRLSAYEDLQARLAGAREQYSSYVAARERIRLELARSITPWEIIAPAEFADVPVEPNIQSEMMRALVIGLLAGLGAAVLRERTDNVFHTPMEAEKELQLPVLGLIPFLPLEPGANISSSISRMSASERFAIKESLRSLFTTFRLLRADRDIRLVGITSSTQGEGKSTSLTVFANTLADLGLRVLIVDADMRLPMQARYLGVEQGDGLSSLLSDSSLTPATLIQRLSDNLDMIPAGPKPPDPAKLLNSSRCQEVVDQIRALPDYDIVLWDAPPCLMLADPILLGEKLDGILFLVGLGKVSRDLAPQACRRIKATGVDVLGLICNQVNFPSRLNDYGYEYGYYYHYAYAGMYGKAARRYASYGQALRGYVKRYRDTYLRRGYRDSYLVGRYRSSYLSNRYLRDGYAVQGYQDAAANGSSSNGGTANGNGNGSNGAARNGASNLSGNSPSRRRGPLGWLSSLARRVPFLRRRGGPVQPYNSDLGSYNRGDEDRGDETKG